MKQNTLLLRAVLPAGLLLAPIALLVSGCSGGGSSAFNPTPSATAIPTGTTPAPTGTTPAPTGTTPAPTSTPITSNVVLGNGQKAVLNLNRNGTKLTGTIQILAPNTVRSSAAINFTIGFGSYPVTGTFTLPNSYTLNGNFGSFGAFKLTGTLPSATQAGTYTLTVNGQTETGVLPKVGAPFPTSTPNPTTPPSTGYNATPNLKYTKVSAGSDAITTPITAFTEYDTGSGSNQITTSTTPGFKFEKFGFSGKVESREGNNLLSRNFTFVGSTLRSTFPFDADEKFVVGQQLPLNNIGQNTVVLSQAKGLSIAVWNATSGVAIIKSISQQELTIEFKNTTYTPYAQFGGKGTFSLDGTVTFRNFKRVTT